MGLQGQVWRLTCGDAPAGEILVEEADFPWLRGRFVAGPAFAAVEPLFARCRALADSEEWEAFDTAYEEVGKAVVLASPSGPVAEFLLHIQDGRAWFRWSDEPFAATAEHPTRPAPNRPPCGP
ncbi:hypothetical protein [Kitasatospora paranensis]|uniref:Uncharacterized protein n=1 Tax=Kitasatospora paranensis TaxID=258053 RepID=A0ABW2G263_9ACTN